MRRVLLTLACCCILPPGVQAQEQEHAPWLNAFGRFWGIGYSAGYHAHTNSRLGMHHYSPDHNVVPQPPRGLAANPNLYAGSGHPSANYYAAPYVMSLTAPYHDPTSAPQPVASQSPMSSQNMAPAPPKPVEPPPNWLKQYMKPNGAGEQNSADERRNDNSPSDRRGVMLAPDASDSTTSLSITPAQPSAPAQPTVQIGGRPVISVLQH